ncbi:MAG: class I SAM-dependent methyltransferase [Ruminococcaceae bacterium]|nr:class I SAM-dependent methyltransferase [Oscillospiraceae bacterium]
MTSDVIRHYDGLIEQDNDPFHDPPVLQEYMDKWDGADFLNALSLKGSEAVLEIGIGTGRVAAKTAPLCGELWGIDISPKTIERAEENLAHHKNVKLVCGDMLTFPFKRSFDVVYSSLTFMHFKDKQAAVAKATCLLKTGGRFVLSLDKNQSKFIDMGNYKLEVYPDNPEEMTLCASRAGLDLISRCETEFAHILVFKKEH